MYLGLDLCDPADVRGDLKVVPLSQLEEELRRIARERIAKGELPVQRTAAAAKASGGVAGSKGGWVPADRLAP